MRIARWQHGAEIGEGFVIGDRVVPFPDGLTVAQVLAQGLDAAHALFARVTASGTEPGEATHRQAQGPKAAHRSLTSGCSHRSYRPPSATSSRSRSMSRG